MSKSLKLHKSMGILTNRQFEGTESLALATQSVLLSQRFPDPTQITCTATSEPLGSGIRLRFESQFPNVRSDCRIVHKFYFIDQSETRETTHILSPGSSTAITEMLVNFDHGSSRDYFNASVYDDEGLIVATDSIVFSDDGKLRSYPFSSKYISPVQIEHVMLDEVITSDGNRVVRFQVELSGLNAEAELSLLWESMGNVHRETFRCTPGSPVALLDLPLDDNPMAVATDYVAIAVDASERFVAQTSFALTH